MSIPIMGVFDAEAGGFFAVLGAVTSNISRLSDSAEMSSAKLAKVGTAAALGITAAAAVFAVKSAEMASDYDSALTHLVTDDGELQSNMKMVGDGMLQMAGQVGFTAMQLTDAMKNVESSGFHGAQALDVLRASAEGAKVGNADLSTVTNAVTSIMNTYGHDTYSAVQVNNALIETVKNGKIRMEDLASAISNVAPAAQTAGIGIDQVLGAMTTMTNQGTDASKAATYLRQTIAALADPTNKAAKEMQGLGIDTTDLEQHLGERGLTGSLKILTDAIASKMGPNGLVLVDTFKKSAGSADDLQKMIANLPPSMQTTIGAMANMMGGAKSMQAALQLTGPSAEHFQTAVDNIGKSLHSTSKDVQDWNEIQNTSKQRVDNAKAAFNALTIQIGGAFAPALGQVAKAMSTVAGFLMQHQTLAQGLIYTIMALASAWALIKVGTGIIGIAKGLVGAGRAALGAIGNIKNFGSAAKSAFDTARLSAMYAKDGISEWATSMRAGVANAVETAVGKLKDLGSAIADGARAVAGFAKKVAIDLANGVRTAAIKVGELATSFARMAAAKIGEMATQIASFGKALAIAAANGMRAMIVATWEFTAALLANPMTWIIIAIIAAVAALVAIGIYLWKHWDQIWSDIKRIVGEVADWIVARWNDFVAWLTGLWDSMIAGIESAWNTVYDTVHRWITKAIDWVKSTMSHWVQMGADMIHGIVSGLESAGQAVIDFLMNLAKSALNAVKSFFGISSPSKVFADEVGHWIPHGIAAGIDSQAHVVAASIKKSLDPRGMNLNTSFGATVGANYRPPFGQGGSAGASVVVNVAPGGNYYGMGGAKQAAVDIRGELLKIGVHTSLGFSK